MSRKERGYPTDVSDEEWEFCAPYLTLMREDAPQREHALRDIFNALRWMVRAGCPWRLMPTNLPPWKAVHEQTQRWIRAGAFEAMAHDLRVLLRELLEERAGQPTAVIIDSRTVQSTPESGARAGYDGHKRRKGSKVHIAVDTLGCLLALKVTAANEQERAQVAQLAQELQSVTGQNVKVAFVDQGYTGARSRPPPRRKGSAWKSSNSRKPSVALCSCHVAGLSNVPSLGVRASVAWLATTSASLPPSRASTG